jgi:hypothetical protein
MTNTSFKHRIIAVATSVVTAYFGFQSLDLIVGIYQVQTYFTVSWYIYAFHIFWLLFIFDLHFKTVGHLEQARKNYSGIAVFWQAFKNRSRHLYHWSYVRHYLNYLIMPSIFYWSVIILMYLNPFHELFKDGLIITSTAALGITYWYFKEAFSHHMELHSVGLRALALVKIFAAFLAYTALIALGKYFGINLYVLMPTVFIVTFLLLYQALFQHRLLRLETYPLLLMFTTLMTLVFTLVFRKWGVNYYTGGLLVTVLYNTCWGIVHKYLERTLTWKLLGEYLFMLVVLVSLLLATHDFNGQI